jgi:hypothetical protein
VTSGARLDDRERRAEGARADDGDHALAPLRPEPSIGAAGGVERPARPGRQREVVGAADREPFGGGPGDDRAVVGAKRERGRDVGRARLRRHLASAARTAAWPATPPATASAGAPRGRGRGGSSRQRLGRRRLEARAEVGAVGAG